MLTLERIGFTAFAIVWFVVFLLVGAFGSLFAIGCTQPPPPSQVRNIDWVLDSSTNWAVRLRCPDADGYVVLLSNNDFALRERFWDVVYVMERYNRIWIGREGIDAAADMRLTAWSLDTACCGCDVQTLNHATDGPQPIGGAD